MALFYNLVMLGIDAAAIRLIGRRASLLVWLAVMAAVGLLAFVLGIFLAGCFNSHFGVFRLFVHAIFIHGIGLLTVTAFLWRRTRPRLACGCLAVALTMAFVAFDAFLIEPEWLDVSHRRIVSPKIHKPVRIVVLADFQTDQIGPYEQAVLRRILSEKPDLILLAGDYLQASARWRRLPQVELNHFLREIHFSAPLGVFAVKGNIDPYNWQRMFEGLDITTVANNHSFNLGDIQLTCLGLFESYDPKLHVAYGPSKLFHIVLGHVPNYALGNVEADLMVAGHTHGGQICLPFFGALTTNSHIPCKWASGLFELSDGRRLFISRGTGCERGYVPPMRFFCRPELAVIDLVPEEQVQATADERKSE